MKIPLRGSGPAVVIAHRGASAAAPENTLPAFDLAWSEGAKWVEADVQPTSGSVLVILHDDLIDRTTNGTGPVRELAAGQLAGLDAGSWRGPEFSGTPIPTLGQLLDGIPADGHLLLEVKGEFTQEQLAILMHEVESHPAADRVALQSFELPALESLLELRPGSGDAPAVDLGLLRETVDADPVAMCAQFGASSYNPDYAELLRHPEAVEVLHTAGIAVAVWTSDDPAEWAALDQLGVDAIITNTPGELLAWQRGRGHGA